MTPLLPWRPGELVADADLALLGDIDPHQLIDTRRQLAADRLGVTVEHLDVDDLADLAVRDLHRGVTHLAGLLAEDGTEQTLLRSQLGLALRGDLADEHIARTDLGTDADDAAFVEVGDFLAQVRDVPGDFFGAELGVAGIDLVLLDVDRREHVVLHQALGEDDGVLEVVALPRHEGDEQVLAERQLTVIGGRTVGEKLALLTLSPSATRTFWLMQESWFERSNFFRRRVFWPSFLYSMTMWSPSSSTTVPSSSARKHVGGIAGAAPLDAGADVGRLGSQQRDGLALHVGAHERTVGVVVLEERDQGGGDRDDLLRRDVHHLDFFRRHRGDLRGRTEEHFLLQLEAKVLKVAACGERRTSTRSLRNLPLASSGALAWATTYSSSSSAVSRRFRR